MAMEISDLEALAFHPDRSVALGSLLPGTVESDYWRGVFLQHAGRLDEVDTLLTEFSKRHGRTHHLYDRLRRRQLLLRANTHLPAAAEALRRELHVTLDDRAEVVVKTERFPTELDPSLIDGAKLLEQEVRQHADLSTVSDDGLAQLAGRIPEGDVTRRRHFLTRINRANLPGIVPMIALDLSDRSSGGFGSLGVHALLTLAQLEELAQMRPELRSTSAWVDAVLLRLRPVSFVDLRIDIDERLAFLERLYAFVSTLAPTFNTLKAQVLYRRLELDRSRGVYDRARFLAYLELPRHAPYSAREWTSGIPAEHLVQPNTFAARAAGLEPIGDDEPLVRDYLSRFLLEEDGRAFAHRLRAEWVEEVLATTRLLAGVQGPEAERWAAVLGPARLAALRDRVDIDLAPQNKIVFAENERVSLDVDVKNVRELEIKVFRINALSYFLAKGTDVDTSLDLDGMIASGDERKLVLDHLPIRRTRQHLDLPLCDRPGTYIVELIGNGRSSRALIKKGSLRHTVRVGAAGAVVTVMNDAGEPLPNARLWIGGREMAPRAASDGASVNQEPGSITIPFSTRPSRVPILLVHGDVTQREYFDHPAEGVALEAGFHLERESFVPSQKAKIILRPKLSIGGVPASVSLIEEPRVEVTVVDGEGTATTKTQSVALHDDACTIIETLVPEGIQYVQATLRGRARVMSTQQTIDISSGTQGEVNHIQASEMVVAMHLARVASPKSGAGVQYLFYLLGKTGEPIAARAVTFFFVHRNIKRPIETTLETNADGIIDLGALDEHGVLSFHAVTSGQRKEITLPFASYQSRVIHSVHGSKITLPHDVSVNALDLTLIELRGGAPFRDWTAHATINQRAIEINGLTPGEYRLFVRGRVDADIVVAALRVPSRPAWAIAGRAMFEITPELPLIRAFARDPSGANIVLKISGATPSTRVQLIATRFRPQSAFTQSTINRAFVTPLSARHAPAFSLYVSGRDIGDEYRYVLERRTSRQRPGTMLEKPTLLLNPWALRTTSTSIQEAAAGTAYQAARPPPPMMQSMPMMPAPAAAPAPGPATRSARHDRERRKMKKEAYHDEPAYTNIEPGFESYEFLAKGATVIENLKVDADGSVRVPIEALGPHVQAVKALLIDPVLSSSAELALPATPHSPRDLRLRLALDPTRHYAQERSVVGVVKDTPIVIDDVRTGKVELVDTIAGAHQILLTLTSNDDLRELSFVNEWHKLDASTKNTRYSKYACHELNVFLWRKDATFFKSVIAPYLAHKREKTFVDHFLLAHDLSAFLEPWRFGRLNTVERILLGTRIAEVKDAIARLIGDSVDVQRRDPEHDAMLVATLLNAGALEASVVGAAAGAVSAGADLDLLEEEAPAPSMIRAATTGAPPPPARRLAPAQEMADDDDSMLRTSVGGGGMGSGWLADAAERMQSEAMFRGADKTKEWAEVGWWKRRIDADDASLIMPNRFWRDLVRHLLNGEDGKKPFLSPHLGDCVSSFAEAMCALAFLDLPFVAGAHETKLEDMSLTVTPKSDVLAAQSRITEIRATKEPPSTLINSGEPPSFSRPPPSVLIGQNYLLAADRWIWDGAEQREKYVTGNEMLIGQVYRCQVVITNPTSAREKLDVLLQIPKGALPVATDTTRSGFITKTVNLELEPYGTEAIEYGFYFPRPGKFTHFPAHVAKGLSHITSAEPREIDVVKEPTIVDATSWAHISQQGSLDEVLAFLDTANLERIDLGRIAWRMHDRHSFERITSRLAERRVYEDRLWRYALAHQDRKRLGEWIDHQTDFLRGAGPVLERTQALTGIDAVDRGWYQHLEYAPLINARAHQLGARRRILNDALNDQYRAFLDLVAHRAHITNDDLLAAAQYVLAMDRVDDALSILARVQPDSIVTRVQYDYLAAYCACYRGDLTGARQLITPWLQHPVDRWRHRFAALAQMLDEVAQQQAAAPKTIVQPVKTQLISSAAPFAGDPDNRDQKMAEAAARQPSLDLSVNGTDIVLLHHNVAGCELRFFKMDIELLFSRQPFVQGDVERFSFIEPGLVLHVTHAEGGKTVVPLPPMLRGANLVIEAVAPSVRKSLAHYAHDLGVHVAQAFGQLHVVRASSQEALSATYVKVYGRYRDKTVHFFKDGYTDLRGRFDYATLSTDDLDRVERLALLVVSESAGATIVETTPPPQ